MNRKKIYLTTLFLPVSIFIVLLLVGSITLGTSVWKSMQYALTHNWYHILLGIGSIILGIELFGRNLENRLRIQKRLKVSFIFILKIFVLLIISMILTHLIENIHYIKGIGDIFNSTVTLIMVSLPFFSILAIVVSLGIGFIIANSNLGKMT